MTSSIALKILPRPGKFDRPNEGFETELQTGESLERKSDILPRCEGRIWTESDSSAQDG